MALDAQKKRPELILRPLQELWHVEFPTKSGQGVKVYSVCSYSAGETYPSEECRRLLL
jgi:hypothetical protein